MTEDHQESRLTDRAKRWLVVIAIVLLIIIAVLVAVVLHAYHDRRCARTGSCSAKIEAPYQVIHLPPP